ncbi:MAG TPA: hypothetical protein VI753_17470 [Anaerolineales bacterium]|nr:hypothetical protein [Anaerolineales bacterium]
MSGLTIDNPIALNDVIASSRVIPGDRLILRGGTYAGDFLVTLAGTKDKPIQIIPYPGEHPIIDGSLTIDGRYTEWLDLEIFYSGWKNRDEVPLGVNPGHGVNMRGPGNKMTGCILHDTGLNGSWVENSDGGFFECLIYNCGWLSSDRGHGHAIYTQNAAPTQYHHNNIMWGQYGYGFHAYTENSNINFYDIRKNICFRNQGKQFHLGGGGGRRAYICVVDENVFLEGAGSAFLKGNDITLTNNYAPNGFVIDLASVNVMQSGNVFTTQTETKVFIFPTRTGAHIAIFNPQEFDSVDIGKTGTLHNAQDYFNDVVLTNGIVDMRAASHTVAARIGSTAVETAFPQFGAFVFEVV